MKKLRFMVVLVACMFVTCGAWCQETVFTLLKNDMKLADQHFAKGNYLGALDLYQNIARKRPEARNIQLSIGRCHFYLKQFDKAVAAYEKHSVKHAHFPWDDMFYYAESLAGVGAYKKAAEWYRKYLSSEPDNHLVNQKIWRLSNARYLYEDSAHFAVRPIKLNTEAGELCAVPYRNGIVFMSNRKEVQVVNAVNAAAHVPFYRMYYARVSPDPSGRRGAFSYGEPAVFNKELTSKFHAGPAAFYDHGNKMIFVSSSDESGSKGGRTLHLYFAEEQDGEWKVTSAYPYNSHWYSICNPTISEDGTQLFFSSDMKAGVGGKDIYRSQLVNGVWTKPVNIGEPINTIHDEAFPFLHRGKTLYFSSNGHAGLGGLDIFKVEIVPDGFTEPQNMGYPLNTSYDDFGIVVDSLSTHGYFSSNRSNGGFNDDIYEFDMDLQSYPITISGWIKIKEHTWSETSALQAFPNARIYLIDHFRNVVVHQCVSDASGKFSLDIPYFSQYKIRVVGEDGDENFVSLELPKHRKEFSDHEIVVIKDLFKPGDNQENK